MRALDVLAKPAAIDLQKCLERAGVGVVVRYGRGDTIFSQGEAGDHVLYAQSGGIQLTVVSKRGREQVVAVLGPGAFFGEACLAGQRRRMASATAIAPSVITIVRKRAMRQLLRKQHAMADGFMAHMLARNVEIEQDLLEQYISSSDERLAHALLRLVRYDRRGWARRRVPRMSPSELAEMAGITLHRVGIGMVRFRQRGFIEDVGKGSLRVNRALLRVVLGPGGY